MNKLNQEINKFTKITRLIFTLSIVLILVLIWFFSRAHFKITVVPNDSIVTVDNFPIKLNRYGKGSIYTSPGKHTVKVEADQYVGISKELYFKRGLTTNLVIDLKEMPEQVLIEEKGSFLTKGKGKNEFLYLDTTKSQLFRATIDLAQNNKLNVQKLALTDKKLSKVDEIIWGPDNDLALFRIGNRVDLFDFQKYDFVNQTQKPWGEDIGSIAWAPDNSKIAYYYAPPSGERSLIFANLDNSEKNRFIGLNNELLQIENPLLRWSPDSRWLLIIPRNKQYDQNKIYLLDAYSRQINTLTDLGNQLDAKFSPDASSVLYTTYSLNTRGQITPLVSIMNRDGKNQKTFDIKTELSKIVWKSNSDSLIAVTRNETSDSDYISIFDMNRLEKNSDSIILSQEQKIKLLQLLGDDKIIVYETDQGIYASRMEE